MTGDERNLCTIFRSGPKGILKKGKEWSKFSLGIIKYKPDSPYLSF